MELVRIALFKIVETDLPLVGEPQRVFFHRQRAGLIEEVIRRRGVENIKERKLAQAPGVFASGTMTRIEKCPVD